MWRRGNESTSLSQRFERRRMAAYGSARFLRALARSSLIDTDCAFFAPGFRVAVQTLYSRNDPSRKKDPFSGMLIAGVKTSTEMFSESLPNNLAWTTSNVRFLESSLGKISINVTSHPTVGEKGLAVLKNTG